MLKIAGFIHTDTSSDAVSEPLLTIAVLQPLLILYSIRKDYKGLI